MKDDLETLRRFNQKVARLEDSGFAKRYAHDIPKLVAKFEEPVFRDNGGGNIGIYGRVSSHLEDFNRDEIDAFVLTHRILTQNNDGLSVGSLAKIYSKAWMPGEARVRFGDARAKAKCMARYGCDRTGRRG